MERIPPPSFSLDDLLVRRDRRLRRQRIAAGVVALAAFVAVVVWLGATLRPATVEPAKGGFPTRAEYIRQADEICANARSRYWHLPDAKDRVGVIFEGMVDDLRALTPPAHLWQKADAMLDAFDRYLDLRVRADAAKRAGNEQAYGQLQERIFGTAWPRVETLFARFGPFAFCP